MPSATDFLPSYIRLFMNFARITSPNLASGITSRFSARCLRDMSSVPSYLPCWIPGLGSAGAGMTIAPGRWLLRSFGAVDRAALFAILDSLCIEHTAQDVVAHARQILDAA